MTEAIFGLIGVALGGLLTGGATYLLARRTEKLEARASARLLQGELYEFARQLALFVHVAAERERVKKSGDPRLVEAFRRSGLDREADSDDVTFGYRAARFTHFSMDKWGEHQVRLAHALSDSDWYAVSPMPR